MKYDLLEQYAKGKVVEIVQYLLPQPDVSFDILDSDDLIFRCFLNYLDASFFRSYFQALYACQCLIAVLEVLPEKFQSYAHVLLRLQYEQQILRTQLTEFSMPEDPLWKLLDREKRGDKLSDTEFADLRAAFPKEYWPLVESQYLLSAGWLHYQKHKSAHAQVLKKADYGFTRPWQNITYSEQETIQLFELSEATPVVFLAPLNIDYKKLLDPLCDRPVLFVFETRAKLIQQLQFPAVAESLALPYHLVYVMEVYPNAQFATQDSVLFQGKDFEVFSVLEKSNWHSSLPLFLEAVKENLNQPQASLQKDTEEGNWLYQLSKRILFGQEEEKLGLNRVMALQEYNNSKQWHDLHKGPPAANKSLGEDFVDYQKIKLSLLAENRYPRTKGAGKIKLVHVVPQIIDGGHAPSRLLENLVSHHDQDNFEVHVVSTERLHLHWMEYPYNPYSSELSSLRGAKRIAAFKKLAKNVSILEDIPSFERTAYMVANYASHVAADVVVFHGPDVVNNMAAQLTDAPLRVMYDHGTLPNYQGYDVVLASTPVTIPNKLELFEKWNTQVEILPFAIDVKKGWLPEAFPIEKWGIPEGKMVMTTISQHLTNRLSGEMLLAIAEILQRVPHAYYVPLGNVADPKHFFQFFQQHHVAERVIFMGSVPNPSQYARSMSLYLNEFPFGSGLGMLDAMASGCPVVSMYDPKGPPQARYGAQYMGLDWVVTTGNRGDYVELACRLLTDKDLYRKWSEHAIEQYEKYANVRSYVQSFEKIIENYLLKDSDSN